MTKEKVLIFGTIGLGRHIRFSLDSAQYDICGYVDNNPKSSMLGGLPVFSPTIINQIDFDKIIIASYRHWKEIKEQLIELLGSRIVEERVIVYRNEMLEGKANVMLQESRCSVMRMCAQLLNEHNVPGSVAEVGVYKGEFAQYLNQWFPSRKLFLFDTFEGRTDDDEVMRVTNGVAFADTTEDIVLNKMTYPQNIIIKKGLFPQTAKGIDDVFSFVSLDTDLYESIIEGLRFFYPKLSPRGYIFVHDFWDDTWVGVKQAVYEFCEKQDISFVPLNDLCGSVIITK